MPRADIGSPALSIFFGTQLLEIIADDTLAFLLKDLLEERNAPAAAGSCSATLGELAGDLRPFAAAIIHQFAPGDVKTVTDFCIKIHGLSVTSQSD
jgi:hypothetical protein